MKLTILRLEHFSAQDQIDLGKIWPEYSASSLHAGRKDKNHLAIFQEFRVAGRRQVMKSPGAYISK